MEAKKERMSYRYEKDETVTLCPSDLHADSLVGRLRGVILACAIDTIHPVHAVHAVHPRWWRGNPLHTGGARTPLR